MRSLFWVAYTTTHELIHERFFHLILFFALGSLLMSALLGSLTYADQAKLTLDFMLGTVHLSAVLFSIFIAITLFRREMTSGSAFLVLSKPISRPSFLWGKFLGQAVIQFVLVASMLLLTLLMRVRFGVPLYASPLLQAGALIYLETLILAAFTYFFIIQSGAVLTAVSAIVFFGLGHFKSPVTRELSNSSSVSWSILRPLIPDLEVLNLKSLASYGISLGTTEMGYVVLYGLCHLAFLLILGGIIFQHKDISQ